MIPGELERRIEKVLADYFRGLGFAVEGGPGHAFDAERDPFVEVWVEPQIGDQEAFAFPVEITFSDLAKHLIKELDL